CLLFCYCLTAQTAFTIISSQAGIKQRLSNVVSAEDGKGGVWLCYRSIKGEDSPANLFLQRINAEGNPVLNVRGVQVNPSTKNQSEAQLLTDENGIYVLFEEFVSSDEQPEIFLFRFGLDGVPVWKKPLRIGKGRSPKIRPDYKGGVYVVWEENQSQKAESDIYAQRVSATGGTFWQDPFPVCTHKGLQQNFDAVVDASHELTVVWEDFRSGKQWHLYAQKINLQGNALWEIDGVQLVPDFLTNQRNPSAVGDGFGGLVVAYETEGNFGEGKNIYLLRYVRSGILVYNHAICTYSENQENPKLTKKGSDLFLYWTDERAGHPDIYYQQIEITNANIKLSSNGEPLVAVPGSQQSWKITPSSTYGEQIITWFDDRNLESELYVQRIDWNGTMKWGKNGMSIFPKISQPESQAVAAGEGGRVWIAWISRKENPDGTLWLMRLLPDGFTEIKPKVIINSASTEPAMLGVPATAAGKDFTLLVWADYRSGSKNADLYMQAISPQGNLLWQAEGKSLCTAPGEQTRPKILVTRDGFFWVAWVDKRGKDENIYVQRIAPDGTILFAADGIPVCTARRNQTDLSLVEGLNGRLLLTW
ncbi:MAG: hypothetical protein NZ108_08100, partial [Bacteroidia bacterium]|nr:hypothetical protein [Bacteroidia bacterium]